MFGRLKERGASPEEQAAAAKQQVATYIGRFLESWRRIQKDYVEEGKDLPEKFATLLEETEEAQEALKEDNFDRVRTYIEEMKADLEADDGQPNEDMHAGIREAEEVLKALDTLESQ